MPPIRVVLLNPLARLATYPRFNPQVSIFKQCYSYHIVETQNMIEDFELPLHLNAQLSEQYLVPKFSSTQLHKVEPLTPPAS